MKNLKKFAFSEVLLHLLTHYHSRYLIDWKLNANVVSLTIRQQERPD
mgnify:CR=1 FL=1